MEVTAMVLPSGASASQANRFFESPTFSFVYSKLVPCAGEMAGRSKMNRSADAASFFEMVFMTVEMTWKLWQIFLVCSVNALAEKNLKPVNNSVQM